MPLAALAAILAVVAWNIADFAHVRRILTSAAIGDRIVLLTTFLVTVFVDLTTAIEIGVVLAALLFMHRMADAVEIEAHGRLIDEDTADSAPRDRGVIVPPEESDIVVYRINGPFFFGATEKFSRTLSRMGQTPRLFVLDLGAVPFVDSTAATALRSFVDGARKRQAGVALVGVRPAVRKAIAAHGMTDGIVSFAASIEAAAAFARKERSAAAPP